MLQLNEIPDKKISGKVAMMIYGESTESNQPSFGAPFAIQMGENFSAELAFQVDYTAIQEAKDQLLDSLYDKPVDPFKVSQLMNDLDELEDNLDFYMVAGGDQYGFGSLDGCTVESDELDSEDRVLGKLLMPFTNCIGAEAHNGAVAFIHGLGEYLPGSKILVEEFLHHNPDLFQEISEITREEVDYGIRTYENEWGLSDVIWEDKGRYRGSWDDVLYAQDKIKERGRQVMDLYDELLENLPGDVNGRYEELFDEAPDYMNVKEIAYGLVDWIVEDSGIEIDPDQIPVNIPATLF